MPSVLALDVGSTMLRALVHDAAGLPERPATTRLYETRDADELVELVRATMEQHLGGRRVDAVGVSCFGHSLLLLDDAGRPTSPIVGWRDADAGMAVEQLAARVDPVAVHARTGCHLHTSYWPAKLAWLRDQDPPLLARSRLVGFQEYLVASLAGQEPSMSLSMASSTGLLDLRRRAWDTELLHVLELEPGRLPRVGDEPVGADVPWFPAVLDGACSNVGTGCMTRERATLMIGTSGAFRVVREEPSPEPRRGLFLYLLDQARVAEGGALSDGGNVYYWLRDTLAGRHEPIAGRAAAAHGLTFLTLLGGERSTGWKIGARGAIAGLTFRTTPLDLRQAALEGVAYRFAEVAELMPEVAEVVATGGPLLRDGDWVQVMADVLERPIAASGVAEASARGAAVLALERLGETPAEAPLDRVYEPRADRFEAHRIARDRVRRLYEAMT